MTLLLFILILGLLVLVHELGHFWAARRSGVGVDEFGFGFPPRLWGVRRGPTMYSINLIPFGGFVRLVGESDPQAPAANSFAKAPLHRRLWILVAGVGMNYLLAWLLFSAALGLGVTTATATAPTDSYARVSNVRVEAYVSPGSLAANSGLSSGARILTINDKTFTTTTALIDYIDKEKNPTLRVRVLAPGGVPKTYTLTPPATRPSNQPLYGFGLQEVGQVRYDWYVAPWYGFQYLGTVTGQTFSGFFDLVGSLIAEGKISEDLSGPIGIAVITGEVRQLGLIPIMQFMAVLSVSLAVINFLPLPALDGGRAFFAILDRVSPRRINPRWEQAVHAAGFYLLLLLVVLISIRDVQRFDIFDRVRQLFN